MASRTRIKPSFLSRPAQSRPAKSASRRLSSRAPVSAAPGEDVLARTMLAGKPRASGLREQVAALTLRVAVLEEALGVSSAPEQPDQSGAEIEGDPREIAVPDELQGPAPEVVHPETAAAHALAAADDQADQSERETPKRAQQEPARQSDVVSSSDVSIADLGEVDDIGGESGFGTDGQGDIA